MLNAAVALDPSHGPILVTGSNGFIGGAVASALLRTGLLVRMTQRSLDSISRYSLDLTYLGDWSAALQGCQCVVHCAARVHQMNDLAADPLTEFRQINTAGTLHLARQAAQAGVRRFIFLSSIKVNGEATLPGDAFDEAVISPPVDPYGLSKYEAEQGLLQIAKKTGMEVVILRLPLVYGPGVKGNFAQMLRWVRWGLPLPFASIQNLRSFLGVDNLCDVVTLCLFHPAAANQVFVLSDGEDVTTPQLLRLLAAASGSASRLFPFPVRVLTFLANWCGLGSKVERLTGSLQVDSRKIQQHLNWVPQYSLIDGLQRMLALAQE